tara:strand:- start:121 stop:384 length:264 start_codon:yes stop_codon:yes gene_type:complete
MYKSALKITYFLVIIFFLIFIFSIYFSNNHRNKIIDNRENYNKNFEMSFSELPFLKNDTNNIIEYNTEKLNNTDVDKRYFWNLLKND